MTKEQAINLGFVPFHQFTVTDSFTYPLERNKVLSFGCIGTPNEMLFLGQLNDAENGYDDLICLHNYNYDGNITEKKLNRIIEALN